MSTKIGDKIVIIDWEDTRLPEENETIEFTEFMFVEQDGNETILIYLEDETIRCSSRVVINQLTKLAESFDRKVLDDKKVTLPEQIQATFNKRQSKKAGHNPYWILV